MNASKGSLPMAVTLSTIVLFSPAVIAEVPIGAIQHHAETIEWRPGPPSLPEGVEVVVLEGSPAKAEIFTMRVRMPAGARIAPHSHPLPERVTILEGVVGLGFGKSFDQTSLKIFRSGDYYVNPPGSHHFLSFVETSTVQITGMGPWKVDYVAPAN